jgi:hypothetical protein
MAGGQLEFALVDGMDRIDPSPEDLWGMLSAAASLTAVAVFSSHSIIGRRSISSQDLQTRRRSRLRLKNCQLNSTGFTWAVRRRRQDEDGFGNDEIVGYAPVVQDKDGAGIVRGLTRISISTACRVARNVLDPRLARRRATGDR